MLVTLQGIVDAKLAFGSTTHAFADVNNAMRPLSSMISLSSLGPPHSHCNLSSCRCQFCRPTSNWSRGSQLATFPTFPALLTSLGFFRRAKVAKVANVVRAKTSVRSSAVAPSFENFCDQVLGSWKGWSSEKNQRTQQLLESESSVETSETTAPEMIFTECDTKVTPIMRNCAACAGVVQGTNDWIRLDRDQKGFVFFDCGSWSADELQGESLVITTAIQSGDQRRVVSCKVDLGQVKDWKELKDVQSAIQSLSQRGSSIRPPRPATERRSAWPRLLKILKCRKQLDQLEGHGIEATTRSKSFISTRLSWKNVQNAPKTIMDLWEGALEYELPHLVFLAVKSAEEAFWILVVAEQGSATKIIARKYAIQPSPCTPTVVSVVLLNLLVPGDKNPGQLDT